MRSKKLLTIVTGVITIISLPLLFMIQRGTFFYDIDLACFGSAVLGFAMSYSEYLVARREAMEDFFNEIYKLKSELLKFPPIKICMPLDMFQKILLEEWNNETLDPSKKKKETKTRDEYKQWKLKGDRTYYSIDKAVDEDIRQQIKVAKQTIQDYDRVINTESFKSSWGRIDFFNKRYQREVYKNLYKSLINIVNELESKRYYLQIFNTDEYRSLPLAFKHCIDESEIIYSREETDGTSIFQVQCDEKLSPRLDAPLLKFWIRTYHPSKQQIADEKKNFSGKGHRIWSVEILK